MAGGVFAALLTQRPEINLCLRHLRGQLAVVAGDIGLPDRQPPADIERFAQPVQRVALLHGAQKIGFALNRRRALSPLRHMILRAKRAQRIGKAHKHAAMRIRQMIGLDYFNREVGR